MTDLYNFRYQSFVAVSGNPGVKVPVVDNVLSSHEQELYPTTSLDENSIEFEFPKGSQRLRGFAANVSCSKTLTS